MNKKLKLFIKLLFIFFITVNINAGTDNNTSKPVFIINSNFIKHFINKKINNNPEKQLLLLKQNLINIIKSNKKIITNNYKKEINNLNDKTVINKKLNNNVAVARDQLKIEIYSNRIIFQKLLNTLQNLYKNYTNKKTIQNIIKKYKLLLNNNKIITYSNYYKQYNNKNINNLVIQNFLKNYKKDKDEYKFFQLFINYLYYNSEILSRKNKFIETFKIKTLIVFLNNFSFINKYNFYFEYYFKSYFSLFILSLFFPLIFYFIYKYIIKLGLLYLNNKIVKNEDIKLKIESLIKKDLTFLIYIINFEIFLKIFNYYNKDFQYIYFNLFYTIYFIFLIYKIINYLIITYSEHFFILYPNVKKEMVSFILKTIKLLLFIIVFLIILSKLDFDIKALLASLGVGGIAVALAVKDTLSNLFGSVTIMLDNSFEQGDWIKTTIYEGTVIEIRMRTTTLRTFDNALVTIPNSELANMPIKNYSKRLIGRRIKLKLTLTYESDMNDIKKAMKEIKEYLKNNKNIATEKTFVDVKKKSNRLIKKEDALGIKKYLLVNLDTFSDSSIDILIYTFSKSPIWEDWLKTKEEVLFKIYDIIIKNNLEFAYPTMTNYVKNN